MTYQPIARVKIRSLVHPDSEVHDERHLFLVPSEKEQFEQQQLDLTFARPRTLHAVELPSSTVIRQRALCDFEDASESGDDEWFSRQPTAACDLPAPEAWSRTLAQALAEVVVGKRPARQIARWVTPQLGASLATQASDQRTRGAAGSRPDRVLVRSVRVDQPADGVAEVAAVVQSRTRSRALMMRLEGWDGRWICTVAQLI